MSAAPRRSGPSPSRLTDLSLYEPAGRPAEHGQFVPPRHHASPTSRFTNLQAGQQSMGSLCRPNITPHRPLALRTCRPASRAWAVCAAPTSRLTDLSLYEPAGRPPEHEQFVPPLHHDAPTSPFTNLHAGHQI